MLLVTSQFYLLQHRLTGTCMHWFSSFVAPLSSFCDFLKAFSMYVCFLASKFFSLQSSSSFSFVSTSLPSLPSSITISIRSDSSRQLSDSPVGRRVGVLSTLELEISKLLVMVSRAARWSMGRSRSRNRRQKRETREEERRKGSSNVSFSTFN